MATRPIELLAEAGQPGIGLSILDGGGAVFNARHPAYGAVADGVADDTAALQAALDAAGAAGGGVYVPRGTYMVDAGVALDVPSNVTVEIADGATIRALPNSLEDYRIFRIYGRENVQIHGAGRIQGERHEHTGTTGEWGMGIDVRGSSRVRIDGVEIRECWGDGIYIGKVDTAGCDDVRVTGVTCDDNRRQGISVVACIGGGIYYSTCRNTGGVAPGAGIDLEPNAGDVVESFVVHGNHLHDNESHGLFVFGAGVRNCTVTGNTCRANGLSGMRLNRTSGNAVLGNACSDNGEDGIRLDAASDSARYNTLGGNTCRSNVRDGIRVHQSGSGSVTFNSVQGNTCSQNTGCGVHVIGGSNGTVSGNVAWTNTEDGIRLDGATQTAATGNYSRENRHGVALISLTFSTVTGNHAFRSNRHGIWLDGGNDNTVTGNSALWSSREDTQAYDNVRLDASSRNNVQGNTTRRPGTHPLPLRSIHLADAGCENNLVTNNDLLGDGAITDNGTGTVTTAGNRS